MIHRLIRTIPDRPSTRRHPPISLKPIALAVAITFLLVPPSLAQQGDSLREVQIGVYISQLPSLSLNTSSYSVLFFVWFRWNGDTLAPHNSFEVVNGRIESKECEPTYQEGDSKYVVCRVWASVSHAWDVKRFPFDDHIIQLSIEDNVFEEDELVYLADQQDSHVGPSEIPGWDLRPGTATVESHHYQTNFGNSALPRGQGSSYSRFVYSMHAERHGWGYYLRLFTGLHVAVLVAFLALWIRPTDVDPRFGLGAAALFAAVASEFVVASSLPETNVLTMADQLHIASLGFIFISVVESVVSLAVCRTNAALSRRLDRTCFFALVALHGAVIVLIFSL